ncbi:MAG: Fe-S protein assembly co-chaperone HscB [Psychrobacter sp.]|uniref:Fe-S protein assembly co-chaperone HscB n=1 Tax=uncultured Psychrobacter sp. TaxID=259303 RepID=UPI001B5302F0|nr:Fe-S protein assembly co-chaperone HscB [uncultured Psychrobacter sp.]MBP7942574.1 Fe-S protein assembly co-chaperone HscB [Psychrobacter sp.]MBP7956668.1 Fe-S protein assembly co-chaperone HscB [Psychrobacter sp.]MBP8032848.1 Fe-S protein assembly co-chaperone HscB [Psychrobacter sp.]MBP8046291.1 Fe-S protein assembly co-chaperone HscB [Psychrobacter sp.]MBP8816373.1 Fe-S protein assembly co-chaperone HscB [Psychrobacter sp.]
MTDITPDAQFDNFFALFEQPVQFAVNQERLDQQLRLLQKRYHPDNLVADSKNVADSAQAKQQSEQASALINQAYQTLRDPDSRASYLLDIAGQAQNLEHSIADLDFLEDAMQMRMDLDDAIEGKELAVLKQLNPQITVRLNKQSERFDSAYQSQDWQTAIDATQKLKFLVKLDADVTTGLDEVASAEHLNDDDLYV